MEEKDIYPEDSAVPEDELLDEIERIVRMTKKSYGYQHLATIGSVLRETYPEYSPRHYGHKKLLGLIQAHPERFKIKWSAPAHKGRSHIWVRLSTEPKRKEGYAPASDPPMPPKPKPRLMTAREFDRLCEWLDGPKGCNFRRHPEDPDEIIWNCDGTLRKTRQWLKRREFLHLKRNMEQVKALGGYCDCEVLFNAVGKWPLE